MTVYILGAGPAGMGVAHGMTLAGRSDFVVIERGEALGGLAQSIDWGAHGSHDLGPHKLFTLDDELMARVEALLTPEEWLTREKISAIYMNGYFLPYPPSPFSLAKVFGLPAFIGMTAGYGLAMIRGIFGSGNPASFEKDLQGRLGGPLYEVLFKPIALKLWGDPADLDVKLSKGRIQTPSIVEVIAQVLGLRKSSEFEALTFRYPKGGLQKLWESIRAGAGKDSEFLLGHEVTKVETSDGRARSIECRNIATREEQTFVIGEEDFIVSSLPLGLLPKLMPEAVDKASGEKINKMVVLNDLLLVFLKIDRERLFSESWVFVPDPKIPFHRVSEQASFDPGMTPEGSIVCCEIMSHKLRPQGEKSDEELVAAALEGLKAMGYKDFKVEDQKVIRLPKTYPVFRPGFEPALGEVIERLDAVENFRTIGRQGAFNYIGSLDAMDIGYGFAKWFAQRGEASWSEERERTAHYPVLD